jgi:ComF family protein
MAQLEFTNFDLSSSNPLLERLSAVVNIEKASALFLFHKEGVIQELIHQLKYQNQQDIGVLMAEFARNFYDKNSFQQNFDLIVPVPLHKKKQKQRGYNQMTKFGENLGNYFSIPYKENILIRFVYTESQTTKNIEDRRENVTNAFQILNPEAYIGKHFLLIDDVITTGATIESCAETILKNIPGAKVSVLAMAVVL